MIIGVVISSTLIFHCWNLRQRMRLNAYGQTVINGAK